MLDVKVGDLVRLTHSNGIDEATIVVTKVANNGNVESESNFFYTGDDGPAWTVAEILVPPLPTEAGLYSVGYNASKLRFLMLAAEGQWHWVDWSLHGSLTPVPLSAISAYAGTIKKATITV